MSGSDIHTTFSNISAAELVTYITKRIKPRIPWNILASLLAYFLFSEIYVKLVVPTFNYGGMIHDPRNNGIFELILIVLTSILLPNKIKTPSGLYNWLYFCILLIPSAVLSVEQSSDRFHLFLMFAALWILIFISRLFTELINQRGVEYSINYKRLPYYSALFFVMAVLIFLAASVRGAFNLNFDLVYDFRADISENLPLIMSYAMHIASGTFVGYLAAMAFHRRDVKVLLLIGVIGVLFFGYSSHKSMLFNPFLAMAGYLLFKLSRPHLYILGGVSILAIIAVLLPDDRFPLLTSLFVNRVVFLPNQINFFYFDFFSNNSFMLWAESKISLGFVTSELPMSVMNYMSGLMTGDYASGANTGWVANAYMNAGMIGIVIYAVVIGSIFALIDLWAKFYGKELVGAAFLIPVITMIMSGDLLIVLLTGGLIFLLIIFQVVTMRIRMQKHDCIRKESDRAGTVCAE
jgi:hypothetical protein